MKNDNNNDNLLNIDSLVNETPIGWSSTCLDQTLFYYLDCNHLSNEDSESVSLVDD